MAADYWPARTVCERVQTSSRNSSIASNKVALTASFLSNPKKTLERQLKWRGKWTMAKRRERNGRLVAKNDIFFPPCWLTFSLYREKRKQRRVQERNLERNNNTWWTKKYWYSNILFLAHKSLFVSTHHRSSYVISLSQKMTSDPLPSAHRRHHFCIYKRRQTMFDFT